MNFAVVLAVIAAVTFYRMGEYEARDRLFVGIGIFRAVRDPSVTPFRTCHSRSWSRGDGDTAEILVSSKALREMLGASLAWQGWLAFSST